MTVCKRPAAVLDARHATAQGPASCSKRRRVRIASTEEYEETDIIGKGAFGLVLQARHRVTGDTVAIKFPRYTDDKPANASELLLKEARFLHACRGDPYVVASHGFLYDPATTNLCLAMEYVGPNLRSFLSGRPPLTEAIVRGYMWQLLTGAKKMHERGIVHRDIKPSNILVGQGGKIVKLCDLGLAMSLATEKTPYGDIGTVPYMAPEMLLGKPDYNARVDTWSLGCVMAEMLTGGNRLFTGARNDDEIGQLWAIFRVLGLPDERTWPQFASLPLARMVPRLFLPRQPNNTLRELVHKEMLSYEGFQVLKGLLECNPDERLTAAAALQCPWFLPELDALQQSPGKNVLRRTKITPLPTQHKKNVLRIEILQQE